MKRRDFLKMSAALSLIPATGFAAEGSFEITRTKAEWQAMLTETEYLVMREDGTEKPNSSPLNLEKRAGTGWPSFYEALPNAVGTRPDNTLFTTRTEVHCRRCGSHLGHIFNDGPKPTGKRHCLNGVSLTFKPKTEA